MTIPNTQTLSVITWLILSAVAIAFGDFFSKKYAMAPSTLHLVATLGCYLAGVALWLPAIVLTKSLAVTGSIWSAIVLINTVLIGALIFKEVLSLTHMLGVGASVLGLLLLAAG